MNAPDPTRLPRLEGAVIALDVDGVVLDATLGGSSTWKAVLGEELGVDGGLLKSEFFDVAWPAVVRGLVPIESALEEALARLAWTVTVDEVLNTWFESDFFPDHDVIDSAAGWADRGARLVLVTNQEHRRAEFLRSRLAKMLPVSAIIYSAAIGHVKDEPEFYALADAMLETESFGDAVVFVDDTLGNVEVARKHGWRAIHFDQATPWRATIDHSLRRAAAARRLRSRA
jgi:putative hydrolase of the HAD superfamily